MSNLINAGTFVEKALRGTK